MARTRLSRAAARPAMPRGAFDRACDGEHFSTRHALQLGSGRAPQPPAGMCWYRDDAMPFAREVVKVGRGGGTGKNGPGNSFERRVRSTPPFSAAPRSRRASCSGTPEGACAQRRFAVRCVDLSPFVLDICLVCELRGSVATMSCPCVVRTWNLWTLQPSVTLSVGVT